MIWTQSGQSDVIRSCRKELIWTEKEQKRDVNEDDDEGTINDKGKLKETEGKRQ